ncbi:MAG: hypothetical protein AAF891_09705, partial [Pseudomonadota bacterium]
TGSGRGSQYLFALAKQIFCVPAGAISNACGQAWQPVIWPSLRDMKCNRVAQRNQRHKWRRTPGKTNAAAVQMTDCGIISASVSTAVPKKLNSVFMPAKDPIVLSETGTGNKTSCTLFYTRVRIARTTASF